MTLPSRHMIRNTGTERGQPERGRDRELRRDRRQCLATTPGPLPSNQA